jgi:hypothetical protein
MRQAAEHLLGYRSTIVTIGYTETGRGYILTSKQQFVSDTPGTDIDIPKCIEWTKIEVKGVRTLLNTSLLSQEIIHFLVVCLYLHSKSVFFRG